MIRPTVPDDTPALLEIARGTGVFKPLEIVALHEVLDDYHAREHATATGPSPPSATAGRSASPTMPRPP